jgi:DNA-binding MarR family transcriptional regulator
MTQTDIQDFRSALRRIERSLIENLRGESRCCGVSFNECHVILEVEHDCSADITGLADSLKMDKSIVSRTVDSLVKQALLIRIEDPLDRRKKSVALSESGKEKAAFINSQMNSKYMDLFGSMNGGKDKELIRAALLLASTLEAWQKDCGALSNCCGGIKE